MLPSYVSSSPSKPVIWILECLDERIQSSSWLLHRLERLSLCSELNFKVIMVNHGLSAGLARSRIESLTLDDQEISEPTLSHLRSAAFNSKFEGHSERSGGPDGESFVFHSKDVLHWTQQNQQFCSVGRLFDKKLAQSSWDPELVQMLLSWVWMFDFDLPLSQAEHEIKALDPFSSDSVFRQIIESDAWRRGGYQRIIETLQLVFFCSRPFSGVLGDARHSGVRRPGAIHTPCPRTSNQPRSPLDSALETH